MLAPYVPSDPNMQQLMDRGAVSPQAAQQNQVTQETPTTFPQQPMKTADAGGGNVPPIQIENALSLHAQGKIGPAAVRALMPSGWSVDLRRGRYDYEVTAPNGAIHYIQP